jgi:MYXO-CTERM domain-containing protein
MKSSFLSHALRQAALLGLAAAAFLCAGAASAQTAPYTFQVTNGTLSGGAPIESVTDDLTFNNLVLTEMFSDGFSFPISMGSLDTATFFAEIPATLLDPIHGALSSAVLTGTLGIDGFPPANVLDVTLQQTPGGPTTDQFIRTAFSTTLSTSPFSSAPAGSISVGQFSLLAGGNPLLGAAPTEIIVAPAVPEASTVVSMGAMLALGLVGLIVTRRRRSAAATK